MNKKILQISIVIFALVLVAFLVMKYLNLMKNSDKESVINPSNQNSQPAVKIENNENTTEQNTLTTPKTTAPQKNISDDLKRIAASFAERFGSYSNHSNFSNIVDLEIFMSDNMKKWSENFVSSARRNNNANQIYFGITTNSISEEVVSVDEVAGRAEIAVKTQRKESTGTMNNSSVFYQGISIVFIKERGAWKVDSATWQAK